MEHRPDRLGNLIREELSAEIHRTLEFQGFLVTLTQVELTQKLDTARVHVSVLPEEFEAKALKMLSRARYALTGYLIKRLRIRQVPELIFQLDQGLKNAAKVEKLLIDNPLPPDEERG